MGRPGDQDISRRDLVAGATAAAALTTLPSGARAGTAATDKPVMAKVALSVNGQRRELEVDTRTSLLDAAREHLHLTGSKKGCDHGQCGACTMIVDGRRINSCLTLAVMHQGAEITTIEGLGQPDNLHPLQAAFIKHDGFQCGYCTPGQICSAVAVLKEIERGDASHVTADVTKPVRELTDDEVRERMSGNICRCGAYPKIVSAIQEVHTGLERAQTWRFVPQEELIALNMRKEDGHESV